MQDMMNTNSQVSPQPDQQRKTEIAEKFGQSPEVARETEAEGYRSLDESLAGQGQRPEPRVNESKKNMGEQEELEDSRLSQDQDRTDDEQADLDLETSISQRPTDKRG